MFRNHTSYTLPELGVYSLSLKYTESNYRDQWGNLFRYKGTVNPLGEPRGDPMDRIDYDVFFVYAQPINNSSIRSSPINTTTTPTPDCVPR